MRSRLIPALAALTMILSFALWRTHSARSDDQITSHELHEFNKSSILYGPPGSPHSAVTAGDWKLIFSSIFLDRRLILLFGVNVILGPMYLRAVQTLVIRTSVNGICHLKLKCPGICFILPRKATLLRVAVAMVILLDTLVDLVW
jgi:hypothetical protein